MWCKACGFRVEDKSAKPNPFFVEGRAEAAKPSSPAPQKGGLGWQLYEATKKKAAKPPLPVKEVRDVEGEEPEETLTIPLGKDCVHLPAGTTVGQALRAFQERQSQWWWLLVTEFEGEYRVCSLGSLLPYLTGRTSHIVHRIGDCVICSGLDPLLWRDSGALLKEALADRDTCSRLLSDLPMAELPAIEHEGLTEGVLSFWLMRRGSRACAVTENGVLRGVYIEQELKAPGGPPDF
jgi:hypothetical protein